MKNQKWPGFFTNLLGVILGISLTFGVNALWQRHEEKKKIREILILVRHELEINKNWFQKQEQIMREDCYVYQKILEIKNDWKSLPQDTLDAYIYRTKYLEMTPLTTSAWLMFQNSELTQKITNKDLVFRLTECYYWINTLQDFIKNEYTDHKKRAIPAEIDRYKYFDVVMSNKESVFFYTNMVSSGNWTIFLLIDAVIDYTISLLDKFGDFRYDMKEKEEEYESFVEQRINHVLQKSDTTGTTKQ